MLAIRKAYEQPPPGPSPSAPPASPAPPQAAPGTTGRPPRERLRSIDRLRGLATLVMIEVHVVNALLLPGRRKGIAFTVLNILNGLVAPAFLFCAGFALSLTLRRSWGTHTWAKVARANLSRGAYLLLVGYLMHSLNFVWNGLWDPGAWRQFRQSDILQVIALSLTFLGLMACALRRQRLFVVSAAAIGVLSFLLTPWARGLSVSGWPDWVQPYFSDRVLTQFTLFPWVGFALLGAAVGAVPDRPLGRTLAIAADLAALGAGLLGVLTPWLLPAHDFWRTGPTYMLLRFSAVCLLGAVLTWRDQDRLLGRLDPLLLPFSRHSLLIYVAHIPLVYGGYGFSLNRTIGPTLGPLGCLYWVCLLALAMYILARAVEVVRRPQPAIVR